MIKAPSRYEGTEVKKRSHSHHTTDRLETTKKPADWKR